MTTTNKLERENSFLKYIQKRIENDNGAKANLKNAISFEPEHIRNIYPLVLPLLNGISTWKQKHIWIPIASLFAYYPQPIRDNQQNFGKSCQQLFNKSGSNGIERNFNRLLNTTIDDIPECMARLVRQMKIQDVSIDYPQLICDLNQWGHQDQYIQDRWAITFWSEQSTKN